jgi:hypothetical protein
MKKLLLILLCGLLVTGSAWSFYKAANRSHYDDDLYGFSIDAPRFPGARRTTASIPVLFTGPSVAGFASNVNVMVQATKTTSEDYRELSLAQIRQGGLTLNSERKLTVSGREALEFDYQGKIGANPELHFLSLNIIDRDRVIVVSCTSTPEAFPAAEPEFRACLASFRLKEDIRP